MQCLLFLSRFVFGLYRVGRFYIGRLGAGLRVDSVGYILILLRF